MPRVAEAIFWTDPQTFDTWTTDRQVCGRRAEFGGESWVRTQTWLNPRTGDEWTTDPRVTGPRFEGWGCSWAKILVWVNPTTGAIWTTDPTAVGRKGTGWGHTWTNVPAIYDTCEQCAPDIETLGLMERSASIVDLNQDGLDDLIYHGPSWLYDPNTGTFITGIRTPVRVLLNDGSGNFVDGTAQVIAGRVPTMVSASSAAVADFNGDELLDVFLGDHDRDDHLNTGKPNVLLLSTATGQLADASDNLVGRPCVSAVPA